MVDDHKSQKQSLYFPTEMHQEMKAEAERLDRSLSWVVTKAWKLSREKIRGLPSDPKKEE
jgi:uncharacterized small protein (TIGR04563 family)